MSYLRYQNRMKFFNAVEAGDFETVDEILRQGGNPNALDDLDRPIIETAVRNGNLAVFNRLVEAGARILTKHTEELLHLAAIRNRIDIAKRLIELGYNVNKRNLDYETPLLVANNINMIKTLIEAGAKVNVKNCGDEYPLMFAIYDDAVDTVKLLLDSGANPNIRDDGRKTPLQLAAFCGNFELVKLLLRAGANPNHRDEFKETALHIAANDFHFEIIDFLLMAGANPCIKDSDGHTILDHLIFDEIDSYLIEKLIQYECNIDRIQFLSSGSWEVHELFMKYGACRNPGKQYAIPNENVSTISHIRSDRWRRTLDVSIDEVDRYGRSVDKYDTYFGLK